MIDAMIGPRRKELVHRVVVGAVNLDAVETGFSGEGSGRSKAGNQVFDFIGRHRPRRPCSRPQRCDRGRRPQTVLPDQLGLCDATAVVDLEDRERSGSTHRLGEPAQAGQVSVMGRAYSLPGASVLFDVSGGGNDDSESAGGTSADEFEFVVGRRPVFMGSIGRQRSDCKTVRHLSPAVESQGRPHNHRPNLRHARAGRPRIETRSLQPVRCDAIIVVHGRSDTRQSAWPQGNGIGSRPFKPNDHSRCDGDPSVRAQNW